MPTPQTPDLSPRRTPLIDALRAVAALIITWHHFALYGPLSDWAQPITGGVLVFFKQYGRATQIFFVIGGYVIARSLTKRAWNFRQVTHYIARRYLRLALPYLGAIGLAIVACYFARGWLPEKVVGEPFTWPQLLAHVFFLQDILGYDSLSAGLWFVCINFQLSLVFVAMLWLRDCYQSVAGTGAEPPARRSPGVESNSLGELVPQPQSQGSHQSAQNPRAEPGARVLSLLGWGLAAEALFFYNLDDRWDMWFMYFFGHFFLGVVVYEALSQPRKRFLFWLYVALVGAALAWSWRWRLVTTLSSGMLLYAGGRLGFMDTWPKSRLISYLGRTSYSLFLIHFPVLIVVALIWTRLDWRLPWQAVAGLAVAFLASLALADLFHRAIEKPADRVSRRV